MKKKFSKILGVGLTLSLLASLLLTAAPVLADVSAATVDPDDDDISATDVTYTITFQINADIDEGEFIYVKFPSDTDVSSVVTGDVTVTATSGIGSSPGEVDTVVVSVSGQTVTIELDDLSTTIGDPLGRLAWVEVEIGDVDNPDEAGDYTLQVKTTPETTWVESAVYEIAEPSVGGYVSVYNDADVLLATFGGSEALNDCEDAAAGYFDSADYTIEVGPGTYVLQDGDPININGEGLTLISTDGAATTIIEADEANPGIHINADDVTVDGFTVNDGEGDGILINYDTEGVTVQNCIVTDAGWSGIVLSWDSTYEDKVVDSATVTGNLIEECGAGINLLGSAVDCTISDNTITDSSNESLDIHGGSEDYPTHGNTISGNIITGNQTMGIRLKGDSDTYDTFEETVISGNTISENEGDGIQILDSVNDITGLVIMGNTIADNDDDGISLTGAGAWSASCVIVFNNITGNGDDGIDNVGDGIGAIDATLNWWGTTDSDDIDAEFEDDDSNDDWTPFLTAAVDTIFSGYHADANEDDIDGEDECGVKLTNVEDVDGNVADRFKAAKYLANPEEVTPGDSSDTPLVYYEVYVALATETAIEDDEISATLKLYASGLDEDTTEAWAYSTTTDAWSECSDYDYSEYGGYIYITLEDGTTPAIGELTGTTFALVAAEAADLDDPVLQTPGYGDDDVALAPTFAWDAVDDATSYTLELANNPSYADAEVKSSLKHTVYEWDLDLEYSTNYYWRLKAVSADAESDWTEATFTTVAAPVPAPAPTPPVTVTQPAPAPLVIPTPIPPVLLWVIVGIGAALIIAVIILIVRTRRAI